MTTLAPSAGVGGGIGVALRRVSGRARCGATTSATAARVSGRARCGATTSAAAAAAQVMMLICRVRSIVVLFVTRFRPLFDLFDLLGSSCQEQGAELSCLPSLRRLRALKKIVRSKKLVD